jgi:hypothetical protein
MSPASPPTGPLTRTLEVMVDMFEHVSASLPFAETARQNFRHHAHTVAAYTAFPPGLRQRIQDDPGLAMHQALDDAVNLGDGWVRFTRQADGRVLTQHVPAAQITVHDTPDEVLPSRDHFR